MKRSCFALSALLASGLFAAAQIPATAQEMPMAMPSTTMQMPISTVGNVPRPDASLIDVQDQAVPDGKFYVKQADAPNMGWLVVRESIEGKPGAVLGYISLHTGANKNLTVPLRALPSSRMVIVSVHAAPRNVGPLSAFDLTSYPLAKGGNKSAIAAVSILPTATTMPAMTPGL